MAQNIKNFNPDVIIIGAGASGLMCAAQAKKRDKKVLVIDHKKAGTKILMAGGGKCNFTNYFLDAENYLSNNPHFCKSAIKRFSQWDFISMVEEHKIRFEEREHGQLFCVESSRQILDMLLKECDHKNIKFLFNTKIKSIEKENDDFIIEILDKKIMAKSLVIATGGPSIPESGASYFGYEIAKKFNINVIKPEPALVPLTLHPEDKSRFEGLSGVSIEALVKCKSHIFKDKLLFTHRGISGPVILKISLYFNPGDEIFINLLPHKDIKDIITNEKNLGSKKSIKNIISDYLPKSLVSAVVNPKYLTVSVKSVNDKILNEISDNIHNFSVKPGGTEGNRTAEATRGGVDCNEISSKTMETNKVKGLYFTGEVLDVTGWLGGYNLQWAWSSGWVAGQFV